MGTVHQTHYRGRVDFGSVDAGDLWIEAEDTGWKQYHSKVFRVRFNLQEVSGTAENNLSCQLQRSLNGGTWTNVTGSSTIVQIADGTRADGQNNGQKYLSGTGTQEVSNAGYDDVDGIAGGGTNDIVANGCSEIEYAMQILQIGTADGDLIELRITGGNIVDWTAIPQITRWSPKAQHSRMAVDLGRLRHQYARRN